MQPGSGQTKTGVLSRVVCFPGLRTRGTLMEENGSFIMSDGDFCGCPIKDLQGTNFPQPIP